MLYKLFGLLLVFSLLLTLPAGKAVAQKTEEQPTQVVTIEAKALDPRAQTLHDYLAQYDSPLANYSQDFIEAADFYQLDWKLVPAISGVESTFGKAIPGGYNGWGWGVYGNQALGFNSWREGIFTVSQGLKQNYIDRGLKDPYAMNRVYATSPAWGGHVDYFLQDIDRFAKQNQPEQAGVVATPKLDQVISSARLKTGPTSLAAVGLNP